MLLANMHRALARITMCGGLLLLLHGDTLVEPAGAGEEGGGDPAWRLDSIWDDGRAEYCVYDVTWSRYGRLYPGQARLVLVKEPWAPDLEVKADRPRSDGFEVLKLNHQRSVPTGIYTYHQMASIFVRRDTGVVRKIASSSAEDCGLSTAHMVAGRLEVRSYFDGVGQRSVGWPAGALPEDGLPALLRDHLATAEPPPRLLVVPSLLDSRLEDLEPRRYTVSRGSAPARELPDGKSVEVVELRLEGAQPELTFYFDRSPPHRLLELVSSTGTHYRLAKCERLAYWQLNAPGGELWLPPEHRSRDVP
jgi:hypothetical protein